MSINISIIVPVYKSEAYLENCINSILHQTYKDFELILVDDGSPDRSGSICDQYAAIDSRIKVIHKENGGASSARNTGIDTAQGVYLGFVDSDDYIDKHMYEILLNNMELYKADISQCEFIRVSDFNPKSTQQADQVKVFNNIQALNNLYNFKNEKSTNMVVPVNKLYKRSLFEDIRFPVGKIHEDEFIIHELLYKARIIVTTDTVMYYYYQSSNSVMRSEFNMKRFDALMAYDQRKAFFKQRGLPELYKKACENYGSLFIMYYFNVKNEIIDSDTKTESMKSDFNKYFLEMIRENDLSAAYLAKFILFFISPTLYSYAKNTRNMGAVLLSKLL